MKRNILVLLLITCSTALIAQVTSGLVAHIPFSNSPTPSVGAFVPIVDNIGYGENRFGDANAALEFTDFNDDQSFGWTDSIVSLNQSHSLSYWFKSNGNSPESEYLVTSRLGLSGVEQGGLDCAVSPNRKVTVRYRTQSASDVAILDTDSNTVTNGSWHHLAIIRDGQIGLLYFDGVLANTDTFSVPAKTSEHWSVGSTVNSSGIIRELDGNVDDIKFYDRALTAAEVDTLANDLQVSTIGIFNNDLKSASRVSVYPNPANGYFMVDVLNVVGSVQLEVLDVTGRKVFELSAQTGKTRVELPSDLKGVFLVRTIEDGVSIAVNQVVLH